MTSQKLQASAAIRSRIACSGSIRRMIGASASIRSNQPTSTPCDEITIIDGGAPNSIYVPISGTIGGCNP